MDVDGAAGPPTAVPPLVNYGDQRLPAIRAGHRRVRAPASNAGTVGPGLVSWIQLDTSQLGAFLDPHNSYIQFALKFTGMAITYADNGDPHADGFMTQALLSNAGAASFIDTFRIYVQGNCVEEITNYGAAQELLCDFNGNGQYVHDPPIKGTDSMATSTWANGLTVGSIANAAAVTSSSILDLAQGITMPFNQSPFDWNDVGISGGKLRGVLPPIGPKLGRPRTFDSALLHQNRIISPANATATGAALDSITYQCCVPLISSFLGMFATKAFPLLEFAPGSVQIQITWAQQFVPFYGLLAKQQQDEAHSGHGGDLWVYTDEPNPANNAALNGMSWQISDINFVHKVIVMPAEVAGVIMSRQSQADTTLRVRQMRYYILPRLVTGTMSYNLIVPAKIQSASALYLCFRTENLNAINKFSMCRYNPGFWAHSSAGCKVQVRIGTEYVPTQPIVTGAELFAETIKAINKLSSTAGETLLDDSHYFGDLSYTGGNLPGMLNANNTAADGAFHAGYLNKVCTFCIGIDFDAFSGSTDTTRSGMFLGNNTMTVELSMETAPTSNYTVDAWFLHDAELVIRPTGVAILYY